VTANLPPVPATPPPGYIQPAPPPGYIPPTPPPGYIPPTPPPGYFQGYSQPGVYPGQPARKPDTWAIASIILVVVLLLGVVIGGVAVLAHRNSPTLTNSPTAAPTVCTGTLTTCATPGGTSTPASTIHPTSAFQSASCPFAVGTGLTEGKQVSCGYVTVPENRAANNGKTLKLAVAIFKGQQYMDSTDPDPVIRLDGGPGGASLDNLAVAINASNYDQYIFDHDVVMFDQRGVGYSTPSLSCPELQSMQDASETSGATTYEQAAKTCYNRLLGEGLDLNGFNSLQNAGDVNDIIHALGYKQMTVYGVSYGTRLALTVMRLYPAAVRATILDSTYPPDDYRTQLPSDAQRVFTVLFQGCSKDPNCNAEYPNLQTTFYNLVDTLNAHPITFNTADPSTGQAYTVHFAGDDLVGFIFSVFYVTQLIPDIPQLIIQIKNKDYSEFSSIYGALTFDDSFSDGLFYSTECSEDWPFTTQQDITQSEQGVDPHLAKVFGQEDEEQEYAVCQFWKVQTVPTAQKQPVVSSIPTLILAGEYDPITPPTNGQDAEKTLSHSYFFEFPGQGHGQEYSSACSDQIIQAFTDNPTQQPDGSCISQMTEPAFV
jgi:pimeloyl-ACP methyl ester carboxylesterase